MVNLTQNPDGTTIEKKERGVGMSVTETDHAILPPCTNDGAWLEMEYNIGSPGNIQKIRNKPSVLLNVSLEEFQTNEVIPRVIKKRNQFQKMTESSKPDGRTGAMLSGNFTENQGGDIDGN
jgi:hypothetical protein